MGGFFVPEDKEPYLKKALNTSEHLELLASRGLVIDNPERAIHYLNFIGYYRLSGYFPPFRETPDDGSSPFKVGTRFDEILDRYIFDRKLRLLLIDALERIEVAVRSVISNKMSLAFGPFWWKEVSLFNHPFHTEIFETIKEATDLRDGKTHHTFLAHYAKKYKGEELPSWMVFEVLSFGKVSNIYKRLKGQNQKAISLEFGLDNAFFESWLHCLSFARNVVAHHSRVWNRAFTIQPKVAKVVSDALPPEGAKRLYGICVVIAYLLRIVADGSRWADRLRALLQEYPEAPLDRMGFPTGWTGLKFWADRFQVEDGGAVLCPVTTALCVTPKSE